MADVVVQHSRVEVVKAALQWRLSEVLREPIGTTTSKLDLLRDCCDDLAQLYPGGLSEASRDLDD